MEDERKSRIGLVKKLPKVGQSDTSDSFWMIDLSCQPRAARCHTRHTIPRMKQFARPGLNRPSPSPAGQPRDGGAPAVAAGRRGRRTYTMAHTLEYKVNQANHYTPTPNRSTARWRRACSRSRPRRPPPTPARPPRSAPARPPRRSPSQTRSLTTASRRCLRRRTLRLTRPARSTSCCTPT